MPKKALIINIQNHNYSGGIETYSRNLIPILHDLGYEIYEYSTCENIQSKVCEPIPYVNQVYVNRKNLLQELNLNSFNNNVFTFLKKSFDELLALKAQRKQLKSIIKNYDLIINNQTVLSGISYKDYDKIVWVQHNDINFLRKIAIFGRLILKIFLRQHLPYKEFKNLVLFSPYSKKLYEKTYPKLVNKKDINCVQLISKYQNMLDSTPSEKISKPIVLLGRMLDVKQKRPDIANKIAKHLNCKILVYGEYNQKLVKKYKNLIFKGSYSAEKDLKNIFDNASLLLVTSDYEGMPYVAIESIMHSTPIAIRHTFAEAENLVKHQNGLLFSKKMSAKKIAQKINFLLNNEVEYNQMVQNNSLWINELKYENFVNKWKEIIKKFEK
ncbi:glycosyltransferase family 4 protein [Mycoplasmoides pirum]|uniref:glycosyltransferase family 4 protein n=1 Tax=Mycoplasmoides pirum TaxID=2122 RepID=UPI000480ABF8|nr:glycosyltransferase family 4 protein [Mycoplasmoides pirum]